MTHSRNKGSRGERDACIALAAIIGGEWSRTAQRRGDATADIECPGVPLHVEVKRHAGKTRKANKWLAADPLLTFDGMLVCLLADLPRVVSMETIITPAERRGHGTAFLAGAMRQAVRDAEAGMLPVVLARCDHGPWIVCWRDTDDDALIALISSRMNHGAAADAANDRAGDDAPLF